MEINLEKRKLEWTLGTGFFFFFFHSIDCLSERKLNTKQKANVPGMRDSAFPLVARMLRLGLPLRSPSDPKPGAMAYMSRLPSAYTVDIWGDEGISLYN